MPRDLQNTDARHDGQFDYNSDTSKAEALSAPWVNVCQPLMALCETLPAGFGARVLAGLAVL